MPQVNVLNADPSRREIRRIFMERITHAKGLDEVGEKIGPVLTPTPDAVLQAAKLLSLGTENRPGMGDLLLVDIGGATTDIHSVGDGKPKQPKITIDGKESELRIEGLQEPLDKRTVEGDVGQEALAAIAPADYAQARAIARSTAKSRGVCGINLMWLARASHSFA